MTNIDEQVVTSLAQIREQALNPWQHLRPSFAFKVSPIQVNI
ncbi:MULTISPECIES: hypothetical protein [Pseudomonas]